MERMIKRLDFDPEFIPVDVPVVIKGRTLKAIDQAKEIINRAREEAQRITQESKSGFEKSQREGEELRKKGYEEGTAEGKSQFVQKMVEAETAQEKVLKEAESQIIQMVMEIARKVISRELAQGAVVDVVKKAISESVGKKILVRLNPADHTLVRQQQKSLLEELDLTQAISIREDESIDPGGCVVETELGTVDARLETQLMAIRKALGL